MTCSYLTESCFVYGIAKHYVSFLLAHFDRLKEVRAGSSLKMKEGHPAGRAPK